MRKPDAPFFGLLFRIKGESPYFLPFRVDLFEKPCKNRRHKTIIKGFELRSRLMSGKIPI